MKTKPVIITLFIIAILLLLIAPRQSDYIKQGKLYINEIVSSNKNIIEDEYGEYSDYIELYNGYNYDIDLTGFYLSDSEFKTSKWEFPSKTIIKKKSYLLIFADNLNTCDKYCHTNFKLSSIGEPVVLTDHAGNIISKVTYPEMDADESYGYKNGKYMSFMEGTPGKENNSEPYKESSNKTVKANLKINEYMSKNKKSPNDEGYLNDWVEVINDSDEDLLLSSLYITDNENNLKKHRLGNNTVKAHEYYVIELDEKIGFGISEKEKFIISDGKNIIDSVEIISLSNKVSYGKKDNEWYYFPNPTKGRVNDTAAFKEWVIDNGST